MTGGSPAASASARSRRADAASRPDRSHPEPVERIVGGIGHDARATPGWPDRRANQSSSCGVSRSRIAGVVALLPGLERRHRADDAFLADLHAAADAAVLEEGSAHQVLAAGDDARGRSAEELVGAIDREVGAARRGTPGGRIPRRRRR